MPTYNKITLNGTTLIDLSTDTVAVANDITSGKVGHLNTGATATGTAQILDTSDATATSSDILSTKTAYVNGSKITGSITSKTAQTYTPTTTNQTISSGQYLSGTQTIVGDANLVSANIASGVSIFGVAGSHSGGSANIQSLSVTTNGTYTASGGVDGYSPVVVNVPSSGGGGSASDAVRFIDYDGTILNSYSAEDFANLTEMPANPTHAGLTSQGWNWTLADAKAQLTAQPDDGLTIGQMYITDDGKTRVYITLADSARLSPYLGICPNGTVVVDWGDNTTTDTLTGTSLTTVQRAQHTYASAGDYIITLEVTSGSFQIYGSSASTNGSYLLTRTDGNIASQRCYQNTIQKVELGSNAVIGNYAFNCCTSLASITIPSGATSIGTYAFRECYSLASITIPSSVASIGTYTFRECYSLTSVTIPSGVTGIGSYAFYFCSSLASITIPSGVTSISSEAFYYCYSLASITIPSGVTSIGSYAFSQCYSLASITIPSSVRSIGNYAFNQCYSLASITIPSSVTSIGNYAFGYCRSLTSVTIPSSVTSMGTYMFISCYSLASITISSGVTSINNYMVGYCYSLASITIPSSVTSIGTSAFYNCYGVAEYHLLPTTPPTLAATSAFTGILSDCKIYVPAASLSAYQTATNWSTYASYMVGE